MTGRNISDVFDYIDETCAMADDMGICMTDKCPFCDEDCMGDDCVLCRMKGEKFWDKFVEFREELDAEMEILEENRLCAEYDAQDAYLEYMEHLRDCDADRRWEMEQGVF